MSLFLREHLADWLMLSTPLEKPELSPDAKHVLNRLQASGAMFFGELLEKGILPTRVEDALAELAAQGWVTADSFEGLRALLLPRDKRAPHAPGTHKRRHKTVSSVEFAGRWSLLRRPLHEGLNGNSARSSGEPNRPVESHSPTRENAVETFARVLLRRYGVVFRRLLERESLNVTWYELGRVYRKLEARGEIRGGYFVSGVGGEQFALPEAIGLLRSIRKLPDTGELVAISGADPLNLAGIVTPGRRVAAIASNRLLLRDGVAIASLEAGAVQPLGTESTEVQDAVSRALKLGTMSNQLKPYYA